MTEPTRGERNHNPMNVRRTNIPWAGMSPDQSSDPDFCVMQTDYFGLRMGAMNLLHGYVHEGHRTVPQIIEAWAPPNENDTPAYVADVCKWCGVEPIDTLVLAQLSTLKSLVTAVIRQENGRCIYDDDDIATACRAALVANQLMV